MRYRSLRASRVLPTSPHDLPERPSLLIGFPPAVCTRATSRVSQLRELLVRMLQGVFTHLFCLDVVLVCSV
jgi:hypothetical protein